MQPLLARPQQLELERPPLSGVTHELHSIVLIHCICRALVQRTARLGFRRKDKKRLLRGRRSMRGREEVGDVPAFLEEAHASTERRGARSPLFDFRP